MSRRVRVDRHLFAATTAKLVGVRRARPVPTDGTPREHGAAILAEDRLPLGAPHATA